LAVGHDKIDAALLEPLSQRVGVVGAVGDHPFRLRSSNLPKSHQTQRVSCCAESHCRAPKRIQQHNTSLVGCLRPSSHWAYHLGRRCQLSVSLERSCLLAERLRMASVTAGDETRS
jgi:hypothetical protein